MIIERQMCDIIFETQCTTCWYSSLPAAALMADTMVNVQD